MPCAPWWPLEVNAGNCRSSSVEDAVGDADRVHQWLGFRMNPLYFIGKSMEKANRCSLQSMVWRDGPVVLTS